MRPILIASAILLLAGCAVLPGQQPPTPDEPAATPATPDEASETLADAWQQLFDGRFDQALASFDSVVASTEASSPLHTRARLGQALVLVSPEWPNRDIDEAARRLESVTIDEKREESVAVFDWILSQTLNRMIESKRSQEELQQELAAATRRNQALQAELEQARSERAQAEETVSRLRELIMGED